MTANRDTLREGMRETVLQSLETGAPGLSAATRQAIARSIILKVEGRVLAPILDKADSAEAAEARADRLSAEVEALKESLRKATALPLGSDLLRFVDSLFDVDPDRTADEIIATVQARDPDALEKQVYNALGYLTRRKRVRRLAYGRYTALARAAVKAETEDRIDG